MDWVETAGYVASGLVFMTFYMKTLIPLRLLAIASNIVFIAYAWGADLTPVLLLHAALLPLNMLRTHEQIKTYRSVRRVARDEVNVDALVPFMLERLGPKGEVLFRKGDTASDIFYISQGAVEIPEIGKVLGPGELFGEMAVFTPDRKRTASAICKSQCDLLVMGQEDILKHCTANPVFSLFLTKLIAARMAENQRRFETVTSQSEPPRPPRQFDARPSGHGAPDGSERKRHENGRAPAK